LIAGCNVKKAIIIGTGGSAKAVAYVLKRNNIEYIFISRNPKNNNEVLAENISEEVMTEVSLIINCSPVGMFPKINVAPLFNYSLICNHHILYDLVYNPEVTVFMKEGLKRGAKVKNGLEMLMFQAEESWKIWRG
jgi:shikimate dehydrogenase